MPALFTRDGRKFSRHLVDSKGKPFVQIKRNCVRCGGAGGSDKWKHTGWACYRCGGDGDDPVRESVKLYTPEQNAKLDAAQAKRDATRAAKRAEAERVEGLRRDAERAELISDHQSLISQMDQHVSRIATAEQRQDESSSVSFLRKLIEQVEVQVRPLSQRQVVAATRCMDRIDAENARLAAAQFIGEVGERMEFVLHLPKIVYSDLVSQFPHIWSHSIYARTPEGSTVLYRGGNWSSVGHKTLRSCDDDIFLVGRIVRVKATVKKHYNKQNSGEPVTVIQRPKVIEVIAEGELPQQGEQS